MTQAPTWGSSSEPETTSAKKSRSFMLCLIFAILCVGAFLYAAACNAVDVNKQSNASALQATANDLLSEYEEMNNIYTRWQTVYSDYKDAGYSKKSSFESSLQAVAQIALSRGYVQGGNTLLSAKNYEAFDTGFSRSVSEARDKARTALKRAQEANDEILKGTDIFPFL